MSQTPPDAEIDALYRSRFSELSESERAAVRNRLRAYLRIAKRVHRRPAGKENSPVNIAD